MGLRIIGAGLGRTGTLSLKLALEYLGVGPCFHMLDLAADLRRSLPGWIAAVEGRADWDRLFTGYQATVDYPGCCFWRPLADHFPEARVILTLRDPEDWYESVRATIFSPERRHPPLLGEAGAALSAYFRRDFAEGIGERADGIGERAEGIGERAVMIDYFRRWNQSVIDGLPAERLLVLGLEDGWGPLCRFLGVAEPSIPYPRSHGRDGGAGEPLPVDPEAREARLRAYLERLRLRDPDPGGLPLPG